MEAHKQLQNKYTVATSSRLYTACSAQWLKKPALIHVRVGAILYANVYRQPLVATQCVVGDVFSMVKQSKSEGDHYTMLVPKLRMSGIFCLFFMSTRSAAPCQDGGSYCMFSSRYLWH